MPFSVTLDESVCVIGGGRPCRARPEAWVYSVWVWFCVFPWVSPALPAWACLLLLHHFATFNQPGGFTGVGSKSLVLQTYRGQWSWPLIMVHFTSSPMCMECSILDNLVHWLIKMWAVTTPMRNFIKSNNTLIANSEGTFDPFSGSLSLF